MNRKQFGILIVLLIALGGAGWWARKSHDNAANAGEAGTGQKLLGESFPINEVAAIAIRQNTNGLHLEKKNDLWSVREKNDYPANFSEISEFLLKIRDLKVIQNEAIGPSQLSRLQLAPSGTNSGIKVDLQDKDAKIIRSFTLGKKHFHKPARQSQFPMEDEADGRYVLLGDNDKNALLIADSLNELEPEARAWLNKDFFKVERPKAIEVIFAAKTNSWKIIRDAETGDWKLAAAAPGEVLDEARVSGVSSPFASPSFDTVFSAESAPANNGLDKPTVITIDTFDDFTYTIKIGGKSADNYYLTMSVAAHFPTNRLPAKDEKPEDKGQADKAWKARQTELEAKLKELKKFENWIYLVPGWNVDLLLKDRKDLLAEKKDEAKPGSAVPVGAK